MAHNFAKHPFRPHRLFQGGHAQTLAGYAWPRRSRWRAPGDEKRLFRDLRHAGARVLSLVNKLHRPAYGCSLAGIEGSSEGVYMLATARKAFAAGFNVVRMNLRNCGDTEHLTPTLYHGGLTEDLRAVVAELIEHDKAQETICRWFLPLVATCVSAAG